MCSRIGVLQQAVVLAEVLRVAAQTAVQVETLCLQPATTVNRFTM